MIEGGMMFHWQSGCRAPRGSCPKPAPPTEERVEDTTAGSPIEAQDQVLDFCG